MPKPSSQIQSRHWKFYCLKPAQALLGQEEASPSKYVAYNNTLRRSILLPSFFFTKSIPAPSWHLHFTATVYYHVASGCLGVLVWFFFVLSTLIFWKGTYFILSIYFSLVFVYAYGISKLLLLLWLGFC